ncbi:hypothetical protein [Streptomyces sp. NBRC 109706]|uniref:hypothetical protein n=1 Tax=Streptomyces sp. NBRC 109706 TaxID=1550035 RepID=UPI00078523A0|nr:hypothetical protein [Streptomyces sp. NBRC 109706]
MHPMIDTIRELTTAAATAGQVITIQAYGPDGERLRGTYLGTNGKVVSIDTGDDVVYVTGDRIAGVDAA